MLEPKSEQLALAGRWGAEERLLLVPGAFGLRVAEAFPDLRWSTERDLEQWTGHVWEPLTDEALIAMLDLTSHLVEVEAAHASGVLRKPARVAAFADESRTAKFREQAVAALRRDVKVELRASDDPWLVVTTDGTVVDLDGLTSRPMRRTDPEYRRLEATFESDSSCPTFEFYVMAVAEHNGLDSDQLWRILAQMLVPELTDGEPCCLALNSASDCVLAQVLAAFVAPSTLHLERALDAGVPTVVIGDGPPITGRTRHRARRVVRLSLDDVAEPDRGTVRHELPGVLQRLLKALRAYYELGVVAA